VVGSVFDEKPLLSGRRPCWRGEFKITRSEDAVKKKKKKKKKKTDFPKKKVITDFFYLLIQKIKRIWRKKIQKIKRRASKASRKDEKWNFSMGRFGV